MSYEPTTWKSGDVVTSAKLNKLEQGVAEAGSGGGGVLVVNVTDGTCDKTWQEIHDAFASTGAVFSLNGNLTACTEVGFFPLTQKYYVEVASNDYSAATASDYPVLDDGE